MKRIRTALIVMVILIAAALGIYFAADYFSNKNSEKEAAEAEKLIIFDFDENASTMLKIHNESGDYEMQYTQADGWTMTGETDFEVNYNTAINICTAMSSLTATKIIEDSDTAKYGFDNSINLTVTANGNDYTLYVGDPTPTNESFYVMKEGSDSIYLIDYSTGLILCATKDSLKSQYIADFNANEVDYFALWKGSQTDENVVFSMNKGDDKKWRMDKPYNDDSVRSSDVNAFINDAIRDKIYNFVSENCPESDYEKYGFDDPQFVFEISGNGKLIRVIFGDYTNNDTEMYGLFTETGQVVTFYKNTVTVLGYDTSDMMDKYIFCKTLADISSVKITMPEGSAELDINEADSKYTFNGKDVDISDEDINEAYFNFFDSFNNAYFETVDRDVQPSGDTEVTVEYTLSDGTVTKLEYIPVPGEESNTYWTLQDGEYTGFIVRKKVIANISTTYEALEDVMK